MVVQLAYGVAQLAATCFMGAATPGILHSIRKMLSFSTAMKSSSVPFHTARAKNEYPAASDAKRSPLLASSPSFSFIASSKPPSGMKDAIACASSPQAAALRGLATNRQHGFVNPTPSGRIYAARAQ
jgi:hypothetical protein